MKRWQSGASGAVLASGWIATAATAAVMPWTAPGPLREATLFAPGLVSTGDDDAHVTFSPDGRELYFLKDTPDFRHWTIVVVGWDGERWGQPRVAPFSGRWGDGDLSFSPDGATAWFVSNRPTMPDGAPRADTDIWRLRRSGAGTWSAPEHVTELSSPGAEWFPNMTADGWLYFGSERSAGNRGDPGTSDLWRAHLVDGHFAAPENLGAVINTRGQDIEPWISANGRLLVFASNGRPDTRGSYDLYASFRCGERWSEPVHLGANVNSAGWDFGPRMSPDGKLLYFTSNRGTTGEALPRAPSYAELIDRIRSPGNGLRDVYRVDTAALGLSSPCAND